MSTYTFIGSGNWTTPGNWSPAGIPTLGDIVIFSSASGNCTVDATSDCSSLDMTNYTGTITLNFNLTVSDPTSNYLILSSAGGNFSGSAQLRIGGDSMTLTSNGASLSSLYLVSVGSNTLTLTDDWTITNLALVSNTFYTFNSTGTQKNIHILGSLSGILGLLGNSKVIFTDNGIASTLAWQSGTIACDLDITLTNAASTMAIGNVSNVSYGGGTFVYNGGGTVTHTGTMFIYQGNLDLSSNPTILTLANVSTANTSGIITLISDLHISGNLSAGGSSNTVTFDNYSSPCKIFCGSSIANDVGGCKGSSDIYLVGSGSWTSNGGDIQNNLFIDTTGTISIGTVYYNTGTLTYVNGTVSCSGTLFSRLDTTFDTQGTNIPWQNVTFTGATTKTMLSQMRILGTLDASGGGVIAFSGSGGSVLVN